MFGLWKSFRKDCITAHGIYELPELRKRECGKTVLSIFRAVQRFRIHEFFPGRVYILWSSQARHVPGNVELDLQRD